MESQGSLLFEGTYVLNAIEKAREINSFPQHAIFFPYFTLFLQFSNPKKIRYVKFDQIALYSIQIAFQNTFWIKKNIENWPSYAIFHGTLSC